MSEQHCELASHHAACDLASFSPKYQVRVSATSLGEFCNLTGRWVLGTAFWIAMKARILNLDRQILDGPIRFHIDNVEASDLPAVIGGPLMEAERNAHQLGFHSSIYSCSQSEGVIATTGTLRMLHRDENSFLQYIASNANGEHRYFYSLVSVTVRPLVIWTTTNLTPGYRPASGLREQTVRTDKLRLLVEKHRDFVDQANGNAVPIRSFVEVGQVIDLSTCAFFQDKIQRGIFVPVVSVRGEGMA